MDTLSMMSSVMVMLMVILSTAVCRLHGSAAAAAGGQPPYKDHLKVTSVLMEPYLMTSPHHHNSSAGGGSRYHGYIVDLMTHLARHLGVTFEIHEPREGTFGYRQADGSWDGMVGDLIRQDADIAAAPMYRTVHRERVVDFTQPYMDVSATLLLRKPPKGTELRIKSVRDLLSQSEIQYGTLDMGVIIRAFKTTNNTVYRMLWRNMQRFESSVFTESNEAGIERVRTDKYAFVLPSTIGEYISMHRPCDLVTVDRFLMRRGYALAVQKSVPARLLQDLNRVLYMLREIGTLDELYRKWWVERGQCSAQIRSSKIYSVTSGGQGQSGQRAVPVIVVTVGVLLGVVWGGGL